MNLHHNFATTSLDLPSRVGQQSLLGYMHQHVDLVDSLVHFGVKNATLVKALRTIGFIDCGPKKLENVLYRARRCAKRRKKSVATPSATPAPARSTPSPPAAPQAPDPQSATTRPLHKALSFEYHGTANLDPSKLL